MREVDGVKIAFVDSESYFQGLHTPSMVSTARATGADLSILLSPGVKEESISDDELRAIMAQAMRATEEPQ